MNDIRLIDANALKYKNLAEVNGRLTYVLTAEEIDNAPTIMTEEQVDLNEVKAIAEEAEQERPQGGQVVPDNLQGWRYEETPHKIPTFNREELEKARDYWYSHLEAHNEEQNEAAWAAINAIKYCIEHSSGYQKDGAT